ncbi:YicC/YloC family endoribonuclease [Shimia sp. MMG029]|uniref:YicC/YloC family endoribonuclease n=1 Tax=Shimia sp. MMG029 TaxID=3021978 RepID=UPI0022FE1B85|nr:YicC/YloC family endoribonuclease [Shimia sp. MMG029]MDA5555847.1 YicC family protein [Shimia sp. MMG029]
MLESMTGYASHKGDALGHSWTWDLRSVNAKGLDLRLRVPDWIEGLEPALRAALSKALARGSVNLSLRIQRDEEQSTLSVNAGQLAAVLGAIKAAEAQAADAGVALAPSKASDLLGLRGVMETTSEDTDTKALLTALMAEVPALLESFAAMRQQEGQALQTVLLDQLAQIEALTSQAATAAEARRAESADALRSNLARVLENTEGADEIRVAQELAILAVKADVMEELDRLRAHVEAARGLIAQGSPVGRKLDFLMQEFNREANTLCSKAQSVDLTRIGLDLKAVIDQMREQVQNVE